MILSTLESLVSSFQPSLESHSFLMSFVFFAPPDSVTELARLVTPRGRKKTLLSRGSNKRGARRIKVGATKWSWPPHFLDARRPCARLHFQKHL